VVVLGLGAVGSYAAEGLARAGIGRMKLVDFDAIVRSNINRNLLAVDSTIGRPKVEVAQERILQINPKCRVDSFNDFASQDNIDQILKEPPDLVIDAIDSLNPKVQVLYYAFQKKLKVISSMGAALRRDPGLIRFSDILDSKGCPLAFRIRKRLRKLQVGRGIYCVYSEEIKPQKKTRDEYPKNEVEYKRGRKRKQLGSLPTITGIFGLTIAHYAITLLCTGWEKET